MADARYEDLMRQSAQLFKSSRDLRRQAARHEAWVAAADTAMDLGAVFAWEAEPPEAAARKAEKRKAQRGRASDSGSGGHRPAAADAGHRSAGAGTGSPVRERAADSAEACLYFPGAPTVQGLLC